MTPSVCQAKWLFHPGYPCPRATPHTTERCSCQLLQKAWKSSHSSVSDSGWLHSFSNIFCFEVIHVLFFSKKVHCTKLIKLIKILNFWSDVFVIKDEADFAPKNIFWHKCSHLTEFKLQMVTLGNSIWFCWRTFTLTLVLNSWYSRNLLPAWITKNPAARATAATHSNLQRAPQGDKLFDNSLIYDMCNEKSHGCSRAFSSETR